MILNIYSVCIYIYIYIYIYTHMTAIRIINYVINLINKVKRIQNNVYYGNGLYISGFGIYVVIRNKLIHRTFSSMFLFKVSVIFVDFDRAQLSCCSLTVPLMANQHILVRLGVFGAVVGERCRQEAKQAHGHGDS